MKKIYYGVSFYDDGIFIIVKDKETGFWVDEDKQLDICITEDDIHKHTYNWFVVRNKLKDAELTYETILKHRKFVKKILSL